MAPQEIKDERRQMEGDPHMKARRRSIARSRSRQRMLKSVPKATIVIANPTHFSVALRYVRSEGGAPRVVAKGQDLIALKIRRIAEENGIPVIEDKALARSLYAKVKVDQMIPVEFYRAIAEILIRLQARRNRTSPVRA
jgi:flagellar biosynthetic protein FlhB